VRTIFFLGPCDSCKNFFIAEDILTLPCIYILKISVSTFNKNIKTTPRPHDHDTRGKNDNLLPSTFWLTLLQKNVDYMGPTIFNHLPKKIKEIRSPAIFKRHLKLWLLRQAFYSVSEYLDYNDPVENAGVGGWTIMGYYKVFLNLSVLLSVIYIIFNLCLLTMYNGS